MEALEWNAVFFFNFGRSLKKDMQSLETMEASSSVEELPKKSNKNQNEKTKNQEKEWSIYLQ